MRLTRQARLLRFDSVPPVLPNHAPKFFRVHPDSRVPPFLKSGSKSASPTRTSPPANTARSSSRCILPIASAALANVPGRITKSATYPGPSRPTSFNRKIFAASTVTACKSASAEICPVARATLSSSSNRVPRQGESLPTARTCVSENSLTVAVSSNRNRLLLGHHTTAPPFSRMRLRSSSCNLHRGQERVLSWSAPASSSRFNSPCAAASVPSAR